MLHFILALFTFFVEALQSCKAAFIHDNVMDFGVTYIYSACNRLDICSQQPATYAEATSTYTLGNTTSISVAAPSNRTGSGRSVVVAAINSGSITGTGTGTHWAITRTGSSELVATTTLASNQAVTSGNKFTLDSIEIGFPDPS